MDALLTTIRDQWNSMTSGQRIVLFSMVTSVVISALVFSVWVRKPDMAVLTSGADMPRVGEIVKELDKRGVAYKVTGGGRTILVERSMASELAVTLAADGLVGDQSGGHILDSKNVGMWPTEVLRDNLRRVLQSDLARMIAGMSVVRNAQVQLALPPKSVFAEDKEQPGASVLVTLNSGAKLSAVQVRGIANLVSAGVEGLEADHVSVIDSEGNVLWGDGTDGDDASTARLQKKKEIERHLADKATRMLDRVLGAGNAAVSVDVALSWDQTETRRKQYDPKKSSVRSEQRDESTKSGDTQEKSVTNYEIDEVSQYVLSKGAHLKHLTTSVAVNYRPTTGKDGKVTWEKIPDADLNALKTLVMNAVGFDDSRGDRISIVNQRFRDAAPAAVAGGFFSSTIFQMLPSVLGKLIAIGVTVFLLLTLRKQLSAPIGRGEGETSGYAGGLLAGIGTGGGKAAGAGSRVSPEQRFQSIAQANPENVANVMKSWMSDGGRAMHN